MASKRRSMPGSLLDRSAYSSIEVVLSVFVVSLCTLLTISTMRLLARQPQLDLIHDMNGVMQLQELVAYSEIIAVEESRLVLQYQAEEVSLEEVNNRLIRKPGTVIYLANVEQVRFYWEDELILMQFERKQKEYRYVLGKKEWWRN